jgi:predicted ferric reductase
MATSILILLVYILIPLLPVALAVILGTTSGGNVLYEFGRNIALTAFPILALQPTLTVRISWINRSVGTGNCLRFHKAMGVSALVAVLLHPMSLAGGGAGIKLLTSWDVPWFVMVGKAALIILTIHVVLALLRSTLRLKYQTWKSLHVTAALLILIGAFVHSWFAGTDLRTSVLQAYWIALLILAAAAFFYRKINGVAVFQRR